MTKFILMSIRFIFKYPKLKTKTTTSYNTRLPVLFILIFSNFSTSVILFLIDRLLNYSNDENIFTKYFPKSYVEVLIFDIMRLGLWVFGMLYNFGNCGFCSLAMNLHFSSIIAFELFITLVVSLIILFNGLFLNFEYGSVCMYWFCHSFYVVIFL